MASLPPVRRVVTAYSSHGISCFEHDNPVQQVLAPVGPTDTLFTHLWGTSTFPSVNQQQGGVDCGVANTSAGIGNPNGSTFRIIDTGPHASSPIHRTESTDYVIMLHGEITLELENGNSTILRAGDVAVQQGTLHRWHNHTSEIARFAVVVLAAQPMTIPGVNLAGPTFS